MAYEDVAGLMVDQDFLARLGAACAEQAKTRSDETASAVLRSPQQGATMFSSFVAVEPGFGDAYASGGQESISDGQILSAVQANWDAVDGVFYPPAA